MNQLKGLRCCRFLLWCWLAIAFAIPAVSQAQIKPWPDRPIKVVVPAPPGSAPDGLLRALTPKLSEIWGQPITIENVVGASGNIGTDRVAKAAGDGYTLLYNTMGPVSVSPFLYGDKLPYDPLRDLAPISLVTKMPNILTVHPSSPIKSLSELIALAKKNPGKFRYGTAGPGTTQHLSGELLNTVAGIQLIGIPYKSSAQMTTDAIGGHYEVLFHNAPVVLPHIKAGNLKALAITSGKRSPVSPEVPTMLEAGIGNFEITAWFGFMAPASTSPALIQKISNDIARVIAMPDIQERILSQASEPVGGTPEQYAAFIRAEQAKWREVVKLANMTAD